METIIENVRAEDLPLAWVNRAGLNSGTEVDVILRPKGGDRPQKITQEERAAKLRALREQIKENREKYPDLDPDFTEHDLYDEYGLPK